MAHLRCYRYRPFARLTLQQVDDARLRQRTPAHFIEVYALDARLLSGDAQAEVSLLRLVPFLHLLLVGVVDGTRQQLSPPFLQLLLRAEHRQQIHIVCGKIAVVAVRSCRSQHTMTMDAPSCFETEGSIGSSPRADVIGWILLKHWPISLTWSPKVKRVALWCRCSEHAILKESVLSGRVPAKHTRLYICLIKNFTNGV